MLLLFVSCLIAATYAGQFDQRLHGEAFAQRRNVNQTGFPPPEVLHEGFFLGDYAATWTTDELFTEIKPQIRAVWSEGVGAVDPRATSVATSPRWLNTRRSLGRGGDAEAFADFDRLNVRLRHGAGELYVGRRPISLGTLTMIPIWNKLTLPLVFRAGPEWVENPDGAGGAFTWQDLRMRVLHLRGTDPTNDLVTIAEAKYVWRSTEVQALGGQWWRYGVGGITASTDLRGATLKFEAIHFQRASDSLTQWGASLERALGARWTMDVEYLHQSQCDVRRTGYGATAPTRFQVLNGCDYVFPYVNLQADSAWRVGGGVLTNVRDPSAMLIANVDYTWTDDLALELKWKQAMGANGTEFGAARLKDPFGREVGAPSTIYLGLSYTR